MTDTVIHIKTHYVKAILHSCPGAVIKSGYPRIFSIRLDYFNSLY